MLAVTYGERGRKSFEPFVDGFCWRFCFCSEDWHSEYIFSSFSLLILLAQLKSKQTFSTVHLKLRLAKVGWNIAPFYTTSWLEWAEFNFVWRAFHFSFLVKRRGFPCNKEFLAGKIWKAVQRQVRCWRQWLFERCRSFLMTHFRKTVFEGVLILANHQVR